MYIYFFLGYCFYWALSIVSFKLSLTSEVKRRRKYIQNCVGNCLCLLSQFSFSFVCRLDLPQLYVSLVSCREASGKFNPWKTDLDVLSIMVSIRVSKLHQLSSCAHSLLATLLLLMQQGAQDRGATAQDVSSSEYPIPGKQFLF